MSQDTASPIGQERQMIETLSRILQRYIQDSPLTTQALADVCNTTLNRISYLRCGKYEKFSLRYLMTTLSALGYDFDIHIRAPDPTAWKGPGTLTITEHHPELIES